MRRGVSAPLQRYEPDLVQFVPGREAGAAFAGRRGLKQQSAPVEKETGKHPDADADRQAGQRSLGNTIAEGINGM